MDQQAIAKAVDAMGSRAALAGALGVSRGMVYQWLRGLRPVAAEHCPTIERETRGKVRCEDLRPDVDWAYLRGTAVVSETVPS